MPSVTTVPEHHVVYSATTMAAVNPTCDEEAIKDVFDSFTRFRDEGILGWAEGLLVTVA